MARRRYRNRRYSIIEVFAMITTGIIFLLAISADANIFILILLLKVIYYCVILVFYIIELPFKFINKILERIGKNTSLKASDQPILYKNIANTPSYLSKEEYMRSNNFGLIEKGEMDKGKKIDYQKKNFSLLSNQFINTITGIDIASTDCVPICIGKDYRSSIEINMVSKGESKSLVLEGEMFLLFAGNKSDIAKQAIVLYKNIDFHIYGYHSIYSSRDLSYYPSYRSDLNPQERYLYLKWLADGRKFTDKIPVGFGFIYFYTLEIAIHEKFKRKNKNKLFMDISDKFIFNQALSLLIISPDSVQAKKMLQYIRTFLVFILVKSDEFSLNDKKEILNILRNNNLLDDFIVRDLWTRDTSTAFVLFMDAIGSTEYISIMIEKLINKAKYQGLKKQSIFTKRGIIAKERLLYNIDRYGFDLSLVFKKTTLEYQFSNGWCSSKKYDGYKLEFDVATFIDCYNKTVDELRATTIKPAKKTEEPISTESPKKFSLDLAKVEELRKNDPAALLHKHLADDDSAIDTKHVPNPTSNFDIKTIVQEIVERSSYTKNELMAIVKKYNLKTINILIDKINQYGYNVLNLDDPIISDDEYDMFKVENLGNLINEP